MAYARTKYVVPGLSPEILLVNVPIPDPSVVQVSAVPGFPCVLKQTPRAVTAGLPSSATMPPEVADEPVIAEVAEVLILGAFTAVVKVIVDPQLLPAALKIQAL